MSVMLRFMQLSLLSYQIDVIVVVRFVYSRLMLVRANRGCIRVHILADVRCMYILFNVGGVELYNIISRMMHGRVSLVIALLVVQCMRELYISYSMESISCLG